jgi:hypothetical protein
MGIPHSFIRAFIRGEFVDGDVTNRIAPGIFGDEGRAINEWANE